MSEFQRHLIAIMHHMKQLLCQLCASSADSYARSSLLSLLVGGSVKQNDLVLREEMCSRRLLQYTQKKVYAIHKKNPSDRR